MDAELKFSQHIEMQVAKSNRILGLIRRSHQFLDGVSMKQLFTALVRPHLKFANVAWSPKYQKDKNLIEGGQRRATRLVPGLSTLPYALRLERLGLPSLQYRRDRGDMIEVYNYTHGLYDTKSPLTMEQRARTRGHSLKLKKIRVNTGTRQHFFAVRVTDRWNELPDVVVTATSLNCFKNRLDILWSQYMYRY